MNLSASHSRLDSTSEAAAMAKAADARGWYRILKEIGSERLGRCTCEAEE